MTLSCDNCNTIGVEITDVQETIYTPFGDLELQLSVCHRCKSLMDFVIYEYAELFARISGEIESKKMELRQQTRSDMT